MDIKNELLEGSCNKFGNSFLNYFNWNDIDISLTRVDIKNKKVNVISSNYEWVLICWSDDLDLLIGERLRSGLQYWNDYSDAYNKTLSKLNENKFKIDFCTKYLDSYEIFSINSKKNFSMIDMINIHQYHPVIADFAHRIWSQSPEMNLPLRAEIPLIPKSTEELWRPFNELLDIHQYMRFGNIRFTRKEMITIRLLLSQCRIKEISYIQGCSEASEHKRIQNIKDKLGCPHASSSGLFNALKEHGVTLACLGVMINFI